MAKELGELHHPGREVPDSVAIRLDGGTLAAYSTASKQDLPAGVHFDSPHTRQIKEAHERHDAVLSKLGPLAQISHGRHTDLLGGQAYSVRGGKLEVAALGGGYEGRVRDETVLANQVDNVIFSQAPKKL